MDDERKATFENDSWAGDEAVYRDQYLETTTDRELNPVETTGNEIETITCSFVETDVLECKENIVRDDVVKSRTTSRSKVFFKKSGAAILLAEKLILETSEFLNDSGSLISKTTSERALDDRFRVTQEVQPFVSVQEGVDGEKRVTIREASYVDGTDQLLKVVEKSGETIISETEYTD